MEPITAAQFVERYGYIVDGEKEPSELCKRTGAALALFPKREEDRPEQNACLFFDADGTPCLDTYEHRISAQPSFMESNRFSYRCFTGDVFRETMQKANELFQEQMRVATACVTWKEGEDRSSQTIRNRARRLQVLQMERNHLVESLRRCKEAYDHFVANMSLFQKTVFFGVSSVSGAAAESAAFRPSDVAPLPITYQEFSDHNTISGFFSSIVESVSRDPHAQEPKPVKIAFEAKVLQEVDLKCPLQIGLRYATQLTVKSEESGIPFGEVSFVREKNHLITMIKPTDDQYKKILVQLAQRIFITHPAATIHIRCGEKDLMPLNIRKEEVQDPIQGSCFRMSIFGLDEKVLVKNTGYIPLLPEGNDRSPNDLIPDQEYKDAFSLSEDFSRLMEEAKHLFPPTQSR